MWEWSVVHCLVEQESSRHLTGSERCKHNKLPHTEAGITLPEVHNYSCPLRWEVCRATFRRRALLRWLLALLPCCWTGHFHSGPTQQE